MDKSLRLAYEQTNYKVFHKGKEVVFRVGKKSSELDSLLKELGFTKYVFLTAANPFSTLRPENENKKKNLELESKLVQNKFFYLNGLGESIDGGWSEDSFCIFGMQLTEAIQLAFEFSQNAFLYGSRSVTPRIIYCASKI